jgi:hypothetical protein
MSRARTIKPHFMHSRSMRRVSREARLTFIQLWLVADDAGRLVNHPLMLSRQLYPGDVEALQALPGWLVELEREHCIERYAVDGTDYMRIVNWRRYQKIYHPTPSRLPPKPVSRASRESLKREAEDGSSVSHLPWISGIPE